VRALIVIAAIAVVTGWLIWGLQVGFFMLVGASIGLLWAALRRGLSERSRQSRIRTPKTKP
jgi:predicted membrane metal-binding protein